MSLAVRVSASKSIDEKPTNRIGNQVITLKPNSNHASGAKIVNNYLSSSEGLFRFGQFIDKGPAFVNAVREMCGRSRWAPLDLCREKSLASWTWLTTIPRAWTMTPGVIDAVQDLSSSSNDCSLTARQKQYKWEKASREVSDLITMYSYSIGNVASLFPSCSKIGVASTVVAESATTVHDGFCLKISVDNLTQAWKIDDSKATQEIKDTVKETIRYNLLSTLKDVVSFVGGFFGMLFMATGAAILPGIAFITLSFSATVFAIARKLYEDSMSFKPINFFDNKHVALITA